MLAMTFSLVGLVGVSLTFFIRRWPRFYAVHCYSVSCYSWALFVGSVFAREVIAPAWLLISYIFVPISVWAVQRIEHVARVAEFEDEIRRLRVEREMPTPDLPDTGPRIP